MMAGRYVGDSLMTKPFIRAERCPRGHDDRSDYGHCLDEVLGMLDRSEAQQADRLRRGDTRGARYSARHFRRIAQHLSMAERIRYRACLGEWNDER